MNRRPPKKKDRPRKPCDDCGAPILLAHPNARRRWCIGCRRKHANDARRLSAHPGIDIWRVKR